MSGKGFPNGSRGKLESITATAKQIDCFGGPSFDLHFNALYRGHNSNTHEFPMSCEKLWMPFSLKASWLLLREVTVYNVPISALAKALTIYPKFCLQFFTEQTVVDQTRTILISHLSRVFCSPHLFNFIVSILITRINSDLLTHSGN